MSACAAAAEHQPDCVAETDSFIGMLEPKKSHFP